MRLAKLSGSAGAAFALAAAVVSGEAVQPAGWGW